MNSFLYTDGSEDDCQQSCQHLTKKTNPDEEYWNEKFDIEQALKVIGLHK